MVPAMPGIESTVLFCCFFFGEKRTIIWRRGHNGGISDLAAQLQLTAVAVQEEGVRVPRGG